jgi:hypothetical protein
MPRRKPKPEKVIEEKIKENLDSIIMQESLDEVSVSSQDLPRLKTTELMNFAEEKLASLTDAQALLNSIASFYVDPNLYGSTEHIDLKKKMDAINLSAMMFQLKSAQHAITKLLEEIDLGNIHPRIFEVLAQLQSQIMQMPKDYQAYLEKMEQNYKKAKIEIEDKKIAGGIVMEQSSSQSGEFSPSNNPMISSNGIKSRGTRSIMEGLRDILGNEIIDVKPVEVNPNAIVNARMKMEIDSQNELHIDNDSSLNSEYTIEDDIIE